MIASKRALKRRLLPLLLAVVLILLSLPESALAATFSAVVTVQSMPVYADASLRQQIGSLGEGEVVLVGAYQNNVALIRYQPTGGVGYARVSDMAAVSDVSKPTTVTASGARFYSSADASSAYLSIGRGITVNVLSTSGEWARVECQGWAGYMYTSALAIGSQENPDTGTDNGLGNDVVTETFTATVIAQNAYVYASPSTSSASMRVLYGRQLTVVAYDDTWAYVYNGSIYGYIPISALSRESVATPTPTSITPTPTPTPTATNDGTVIYETFTATVTAQNAYVYASPSTSATRMRVLYGRVLTVVAYDDTWAYVYNGSIYGYIPISALTRGSGATATPAPTATATPAPTATDDGSMIYETFTATVTAQNAYVYASPSTSSASMRVLYGRVLTVVAYDDTWAYVYNGSIYGYIPISALTREGDATPTPTPTQSPDDGVIVETFTAVTVVNTYVYSEASTSSSPLGGIYAGTQVTVHMYNDAWAFISLNGNYGFCPLSVLQRSDGGNTSDPLEGYYRGSAASMIVADTTMYADDSTASNALASLSAGDVVTVTAYNAQWAYVTANGQSGFAPLRYLISDANTVITEMGAIVTRNAQVYEASMTSSASMGSVSRGDILTVLAYSYNRDFAYVRNDNNGAVGYMSLSALTPYDTGATSTPSTGDGIPATVTVDSLYVYRAPSTSADRYGIIYRGEEVEVLEYNNTWAYITRNGNYGYCLLAGLTRTEDLDPSDGTVLCQATVVYPNAPFFQSASTSSAYVGVPVGTTVDVYAYNETWGYVSINGQRGYMLIGHLSRNSYATLSSGSSGSAVLSLQQALEALGYFDGVPAGNYSSLTQTAVARFQAAAGLSATGVADEITQRILYGGYSPASPLLSVTLTTGSTGDNVTRLQTRLYHKGYLALASSVDGDYGSNTASAVRLFQAAAGLSATGVADSTTLRALYSNNAPANPGSAADSGSSGGGDSNQDHLPDDPTRAEKIEYVIYVAQQQMGKPYVYGAIGPNQFDCSGFTTYCYKQVGVTFGRTAQQQGYSAGTKIEGLSNLQRGDIVCMNTVSDNDLSDHVGIYLGNNKMIHASSGAGEVIVSDLGSGYYYRVFSWGRRVL